MRMQPVVLTLAMVAAAGCYGGGGDDEGNGPAGGDGGAAVDDGGAAVTDAQFACATSGPGGPPIGCEELVNDPSECRGFDELPPCTERACWVWECCVCQDSQDGPAWGVTYVECLGSC